jgi:hypothetical protein
MMGRIGTAAAVIALEKAPRLMAEDPLSADQNALFFVAPPLVNTRSLKPASSIWCSWVELLSTVFRPQVWPNLLVYILGLHS